MATSSQELPQTSDNVRSLLKHLLKARKDRGKMFDCNPWEVGTTHQLINLTVTRPSSLAFLKRYPGGFDAFTLSIHGPFWVNVMTQFCLEHGLKQDRHPISIRQRMLLRGSSR